MRNKTFNCLLGVLIIGSTLSACKSTAAVQTDAVPSAPDLHTSVISTDSPTPEIIQTQEPTLIEIMPETSIEIIETSLEITSQSPYWSITEPYLADDIGMSSTADCFNALEGFPNNKEEVTLTLFYKQQLTVESIDLYIKGLMTDILSIDLIDHTSGALQNIYTNGDDVQQVLENASLCANLFRIPVLEPMGVDSVLMRFKDSSALSTVISVDINGNPHLLQDWLLFWEQSLPGKVEDLVLSNLGLIFIGLAPNQVYVYDIEGNLLDQFSLDEGAKMTSMELDLGGNLIITDAFQGVFWRYSPAGELLSQWEGQSSKALAISPVDGNLYTLIEEDGQVFLYKYDPQEGRLLDESLIKQNLGFVGLSFNPDGDLFALHNYDTELIQVDANSGAFLKSVSVQKAQNLEFEASNFAFDSDGNAYILFSYSANNMAVYRLNSQGELVGRYGEIVSDITDSLPEMALCKPRIMAVTEEGRYLVIIDDCYEAYHLLTYYLGEPN